MFVLQLNWNDNVWLANNIFKLLMSRYTVRYTVCMNNEFHVINFLTDCYDNKATIRTLYSKI